MARRKDWSKLNTTKLFRPPLPEDFVPRRQLLDRLNQICHHPLTLVSAPAGYGKSTTVDAWIGTCCDIPTAWLSLDETDNDLVIFLTYFVAALRRAIPDFGADLKRMVTGIDVPTAPVLIERLAADLDALEQEVILVFDDFHVIDDDGVLNFFVEFMRHPHPALHVVLLSRHDPRLPLSSWRALNRMVDIRSGDLRFNLAETADFLNRATAYQPSDKTIASLYVNTEGWAAGLRLASLSLSHARTIEGHILEIGFNSREILDYLSDQVITSLPVEMQTALMQISILERMSPSLCDAVVTPFPEDAPDGQALLREIARLNLFLIPLSEDRSWFRFHHLFRDLLRVRLGNTYSPETVAALYVRAIGWFEAHGYIDEAIQYGLTAGAEGEAVRLVETYRHDLLNQEQLAKLHHWASRFPDAVIRSSPDLLLTQAWFALMVRIDLVELVELTDQVEALLASLDLEPVRTELLRAENAVLRGVTHYYALDAGYTVTQCLRSLEILPESYYLARSYAWLYLAVARQALGDLPGAFEASRLGQREDLAYQDHPRGRSLGAAGFVYWMSADLVGLKKIGEQLLAIAVTEDQRNTLSWGHYFLASVYYQQNDLGNALYHARKSFEDRHNNFGLFNIFSQLILALVYQAMGDEAGAREAAGVVHAFVWDLRSEPMASAASAFQIELDVMQGELTSAGSWALQAIPTLRPAAMPMAFQRQLTVPKALLAVNDPANTGILADYLRDLHAIVDAGHNVRYLIEVLALEALAYDLQGDEAAAFAALKRSLALAAPSGFIRLYVDLGLPMKELLTRLCRSNGTTPSDYINRILDAFPQARRVSEDAMVEPLSNRELQVLELLAQRYSYKEIAQQLFIAPGTVKRHALNIYQKLNVQKRNDAVDVARRFGILN